MSNQPVQLLPEIHYEILARDLGEDTRPEFLPIAFGTNVDGGAGALVEGAILDEGAAGFDEFGLPQRDR